MLAEEYKTTQSFEYNNFVNNLSPKITDDCCGTADLTGDNNCNEQETWFNTVCMYDRFTKLL